MSDIPRDKQFYELADAHIALANTRMGEVRPTIARVGCNRYCAE